MIQVDELLEQKKIYVQYLTKVCIPSEDWHGVADAAMDLREIEAKLKVLNELRSDDDTYT